MQWTDRLRSLTRSPTTILKHNSDKNYSCDMGRQMPFRTAIITHNTKRGRKRKRSPRSKSIDKDKLKENSYE